MKPFAFTVLDDGNAPHIEQIARFCASARTQECFNHFSRVMHCSTNHLLLERLADGRFHAIPRLCNSRWCERCAAIKSDIMSHNLALQFSSLKIRLIAFMDDNAVYSEKNISQSDLRHFVFTVQNCGYRKLADVIQKLSKSIRRITQFLQKGNLTYVWKIECTFSKTSCHPHIHIAINRYIPINFLHSIFKRAVRPYKSEIRYASKFECSLVEITKYCTKPSSWEDAPDWASQFIFDAFQRVRVIGCSRNLRLMPLPQSPEWKVHGSLQRLANDPKSDLQGVAVQIIHEARNNPKHRKRSIVWQSAMPFDI